MIHAVGIPHVGRLHVVRHHEHRVDHRGEGADIELAAVPAGRPGVGIHRDKAPRKLLVNLGRQLGHETRHAPLHALSVVGAGRFVGALEVHVDPIDILGPDLSDGAIDRRLRGVVGDRTDGGMVEGLDDEDEARTRQVGLIPRADEVRAVPAVPSIVRGLDEGPVRVEIESEVSDRAHQRVVPVRVLAQGPRGGEGEDFALQRPARGCSRRSHGRAPSCRPRGDWSGRRGEREAIPQVLRVVTRMRALRRVGPLADGSGSDHPS